MLFIKGMYDQIGIITYLLRINLNYTVLPTSVT